MKEELQTVSPYLLLEDAVDFLSFVENLFDAKITHKVMRDEATLIHAQFTIGNTLLMCGGAGGDWKPLPCSLFVYVESADISYAKALELGATTVMGLSDQEYGRTCGISDPFGNTWWITSV